MASPVRQYHTLDRDPETEEWDECPGCGDTLRSKGRDPHVNEYEVYEYFVCDTPTDECRVQEVICRSGGETEQTRRGGGRF